MTGRGVSRLTVKKVLNHADADVTAIYDRHSYDGEKRQALEVWGRFVAGLVREGERAAGDGDADTDGIAVAATMPIEREPSIVIDELRRAIGTLDRERSSAREIC